jgi:hypothetical protein
MQPAAVNKICHNRLIDPDQDEAWRFRKSLDPTPLTGKSATSGEFHGAFEYYNCIWAANSPLVLRKGYLNGLAPQGVVMLGANPSSHRRTH